MTPQHLHATANLWSLLAVWPLLAQAAQNASGASGEDRGTVQAWRPGSGVHSGRAGDHILDAVLRSSGGASNPYAERLDRTAETITWLAAAVVPPAAATAGQALREMLAGVTDLRPAAALNLALHLGAEDRAVRRLLGEPDDLVPLPGFNCPRCDSGGALAIRASNPDLLARPIVCTVTTCVRDGIPSIWTQAQLAVELDAQAAA